MSYKNRSKKNYEFRSCIVVHAGCPEEKYVIEGWVLGGEAFVWILNRTIFF